MRPPQIASNNSRDNNNALCSSSLKIHEDSWIIKKSWTSSSSSTSSSLVNSQQRPPVIIYTHSPKIIHTHPRDFMALVQKLTGRSHSDEHSKKSPLSKPEPTDKDKNNSSSSSSIGDNQVNSCFMIAPIVEPRFNPYMTNLPVFSPNSTEILCSDKPSLN